MSDSQYDLSWDLRAGILAGVLVLALAALVGWYVFLRQDSPSPTPAVDPLRTREERREVLKREITEEEMERLNRVRQERREQLMEQTEASPELDEERRRRREALLQESGGE